VKAARGEKHCDSPMWHKRRRSRRMVKRAERNVRAHDTYEQ
jgi:hypothetical protein